MPIASAAPTATVSTQPWLNARPSAQQRARDHDPPRCAQAQPTGRDRQAGLVDAVDLDVLALVEPDDVDVHGARPRAASGRGRRGRRPPPRRAASARRSRRSRGCSGVVAISVCGREKRHSVASAASGAAAAVDLPAPAEPASTQWSAARRALPPRAQAFRKIPTGTNARPASAPAREAQRAAAPSRARRRARRSARRGGRRTLLGGAARDRHRRTRPRASRRSRARRRAGPRCRRSPPPRTSAGTRASVGNSIQASASEPGQTRPRRQRAHHQRGAARAAPRGAPRRSLAPGRASTRCCRRRRSGRRSRPRRASASASPSSLRAAGQRGLRAAPGPS